MPTARNCSDSGLPASALVEVGDDHLLADLEPLRKMLEACEEGKVEWPITFTCKDTLPLAAQESANKSST